MNFRILTLTGAAMCALQLTADAKIAHKLAPTKVSISKNPSIAEIIEYAQKKNQLLISNKNPSKLPTAKTTAVKSRIVAYAYREFGMPVPLDSSKLYYGSPDRGSDMELELIKFDSLISFTYDFSTSVLVRDSRVNQTFDASDNIVTATEKYWEETIMDYENDSRTTNTYNTANNIVSIISEDWDGTVWENSSKTVYTYDAAQNILQDTSFNWNGTDWEAAYAESNTYSSTNKVISNTYSFLDPSSSSWVDASVTSFTYDASDFLIANLVKNLSMVTFTLEDYSRVIFTNDASGNPIRTLRENWDNASGTWVNSIEIVNTYDASKNRLSELTLNWNTGSAKFDTSYLLTNTYNSYNQITTDLNSYWDITSEVLVKSDSATYYYEEYGATSIAEVNKNSASKVYPVPANNELNVSANIGEAQKVQMILSDLQGRPFVQMNHNSGADFNQKISVSNIPSGNYILSITGDKGFRSVQKITVAH